jgi:hypothetical protein
LSCFKEEKISPLPGIEPGLLGPKAVPSFRGYGDLRKDEQKIIYLKKKVFQKRR